MSTNYPTSLDVLTNPSSTDTMTSVPHSVQHANANDAIEALQAKLGDDSTPASLPSGASLGAAQGVGLLVEGAFGWRDLEGPIVAPTTGAGRPTLTAYDGEIEDYAFDAGDHYSPIKFHWPHDWAPGSDSHIHLHWSHNGTDISGSLVIEYIYIWARRDGVFTASKTITHTISGLNITNTPAKKKRVDEIQFSTSGGSATLHDTDLYEPDGMILLHFNVVTIPTITGGALKPFIHYVDQHIQTTNMGTKNKDPNFWA